MIELIPMKVYDILLELLPMIILFTVVMATVRIVTSIYSKERFILYKEFKNLLYIIYCFALFQLVTTSDFESFSNNFIPFKEILRYRASSPLFFRNVIGNIAIFMPFGFLITDMIREKVGKCNIFITTIITLLTSLTIETIQMFIGRSFDVDDIILNLVGGILGFIIYFITHIIYKRIPERFKKDSYKFIFFLSFTILFILALYICYEVI